MIVADPSLCGFGAFGLKPGAPSWGVLTQTYTPVEALKGIIWQGFHETELEAHWSDGQHLWAQARDGDGAVQGWIIEAVQQAVDDGILPPRGPFVVSAPPPPPPPSVATPTTPAVTPVASSQLPGNRIVPFTPPTGPTVTLTPPEEPGGAPAVTPAAGGKVCITPDLCIDCAKDLETMRPYPELYAQAQKLCSAGASAGIPWWGWAAAALVAGKLLMGGRR